MSVSVECLVSLACNDVLCHSGRLDKVSHCTISQMDLVMLALLSTLGGALRKLGWGFGQY
eukprot:4305655-Amphidinium_carterae.2